MFIEVISLGSVRSINVDHITQILKVDNEYTNIHVKSGDRSTIILCKVNYEKLLRAIRELTTCYILDGKNL